MLLILITSIQYCFIDLLLYNNVYLYFVYCLYLQNHTQLCTINPLEVYPGVKPNVLTGHPVVTKVLIRNCNVAVEAYAVLDDRSRADLHSALCSAEIKTCGGARGPCIPYSETGYPGHSRSGCDLYCVPNC